MGIICKGSIDHGSRKGFTLVELVCVLTIMAVLASIMVPVTLRWVNKAKISGYVSEARSVWNAVRVYSIETYGCEVLDTVELMEELTNQPLNSEKNPLNKYLIGKCSENASIEDLTLDAKHTDVIGIVYCVGCYRIDIDQGSVRVTSEPDEKIEPGRRKD